MKEPKDLGVKIGTPEEVFWTSVKNKCEESIVNNTETIIADRSLLELAKKRIDEEKEKFK